jgi:hypothetical protein
MLKTLKRYSHTRFIATKGLKIMVQLTWFVVPCSIVLMIGLISVNYLLSLVAGALDAFLVIALSIKIGSVDRGKIDVTWTTKERAEIDQQIKE